MVILGVLQPIETFYVTMTSFGNTGFHIWYVAGLIGVFALAAFTRKLFT